MPDYVLNRTHTHRSTMGHIVNFVKGQPVYVPPALEKEVALIGAEPVDGERVELLEDLPEALPEEPTGEERKKLLKLTYGQLEARNQRGDFTGQGRPNVKVLQSLLGFEVTNRERDEVWEEYVGERVAAG